MFRLEIRTADTIAAAATAWRATRMRHKRDQLLAGCDWTQAEDAPVDRAAWQRYRQALRDITAHPQWPDVELPEMPSWPSRGAHRRGPGDPVPEEAPT